jgi:hypothetical protein
MTLGLRLVSVKGPSSQGSVDRQLDLLEEGEAGSSGNTPPSHLKKHIHKAHKEWHQVGFMVMSRGDQGFQLGNDPWKTSIERAIATKVGDLGDNSRQKLTNC